MHRSDTKRLQREIDKRIAAAFRKLATGGAYATDIYPFRSDFGRVAKELEEKANASK